MILHVYEKLLAPMTIISYRLIFRLMLLFSFPNSVNSLRLPLMTMPALSLIQKNSSAHPNFKIAKLSSFILRKNTIIFLPQQEIQNAFPKHQPPSVLIPAEPTLTISQTQLSAHVLQTVIPNVCINAFLAQLTNPYMRS